LTRPWLLAAVLGALVGCAEFDYGRGQPHASPPAVYRVQKGDTLYEIALRHGLDYRRVAHWNGLSPPYTIYPGQRLNLRSGAGRASAATDTSREPPGSAAGQANSEPRPAGGSSAAAQPSSGWQWPLGGAVLSDYRAAGNGRKGITIGANGGEPVRAAAPGRVVYSGSGLRGYGRLVIVKHNEAFLTAYAYNAALLVEEGASVEAGDPVARPGRTPEGSEGIHFELRRHGNPVNPLEYLPAR